MWFSQCAGSILAWFAVAWYVAMKGTVSSGVLQVKRYVSLIKERVGVSDLLFPRSICCCCSACIWIRIPNNSYACLLYMVSAALMFLPLGRIRVYCVICVWNMQMWGCYSLCSVCVLCNMWLLVFQIVQYRIVYLYCIWADKFHWCWEC
jgi:hypothetical protein